MSTSPRFAPRYQRGQVIGGEYLVHRVLIGGMGEVYLCLNTTTIQPYALKIFQARFIDNPMMRESFKREVGNWIALEKHPNIVRCFFMDTLDNQPFMILEWVAGDESLGTDLRAWLQQGPLNLRRSLDLAIDICRGLIHAGQKQPGIVHRDLKPENILIAENGTAKITDFGLAKIAHDANLARNDLSSAPSGSGIAGTPPYMAPEQ